MSVIKLSRSGSARTLVKETGSMMVFILPALLTLLFLLLYPFGYGIYISLFKTNLVNKWAFVGLKNYVDAFAAGELWNSLGLTFQFTFFVVLGHMLLGVGLALLLNRNFRGRTVYRALLMLPWLFPEVVAANLWKWIQQHPDPRWRDRGAAILPGQPAIRHGDGHLGVYLERVFTHYAAVPGGSADHLGRSV